MVKLEKETGKRKIFGVAIVVVSRDGKILVVQETIDRPERDRRAGDWTVPAESVEKGERPLDTLRRLIQEEIGGLKNITFDSENDWLGDYQLNPGLWGRAFVLHFNGVSTQFQSFVAEKREVVNHQWIEPEEIRNMQRRGAVLEVVNDFIDGKRGVTCKQISLAH